MCTLSSQHRRGTVKNECKHRTWAPFVALFFWRESCFFVAAVPTRERRSRRQGGLLVSIVAELRGRQLCPGSGCSRYSHLTSFFVLVTRTSQREHVSNEGFMELSTNPCPHLFSLLSLFSHRDPPVHCDASWLSQGFPFPSCSFKVIWKVFVMIQWFTTSSKLNHIRHLTTLSQLTARTLNAALLPKLQQTLKNTIYTRDTVKVFCIQTQPFKVVLVKLYKDNLSVLSVFTKT